MSEISKQILTQLNDDRCDPPRSGSNYCLHVERTFDNSPLWIVLLMFSENIVEYERKCSWPLSQNKIAMAMVCLVTLISIARYHRTVYYCIVHSRKTFCIFMFCFLDVNSHPTSMEAVWHMNIVSTQETVPVSIVYIFFTVHVHSQCTFMCIGWGCALMHYYSIQWPTNK